MKRFRLKKLEAHNKELSETLGYTAEGVEFSDGTCVLHWLRPLGHLAIYESIEIIEFKYGHGSKIVTEWVDMVIGHETVDSKSVNCEYCKSVITDDYSLVSISNEGKRRFFCNHECYDNWYTGIEHCDHRVLHFSPIVRGYFCIECKQVIQ